MLKIWTQKILDRMLYCKDCRAITRHDILAKEMFSVHCAVRPEIPLVCKCSVCGAFFVAFSREMYFGRPSEGSEYAKLLSQNRLAVNDWVYIDGKASPGRVKAIYTTQTEDVVELNFGGNRLEKCSRPLMTRFNEKASAGFRLLPAQCGVALLGDPVYHVLRKAFGTVVGMVTDRGEEKLVVQLENGKVLFITLPEERQLVPDSLLKERLSERLSERFPKLPGQLKVDVVHAIAYVHGTVERFPDKENVLSAVRQMRDFRGVIDLAQVFPARPVADDEIRAKVLDILDGRDSPFFNDEVEVGNGEATVKALYFAGSNLAKTRERIGEIPGLRGLTLELKAVSRPPSRVTEQAERLSYALRSNICLSRCRLQVTPLEDEIIVKCEPSGLIQKKLINRIVVRVMKGVDIPTHLCMENG